MNVLVAVMLLGGNDVTNGNTGIQQISNALLFQTKRYTCNYCNGY